MKVEGTLLLAALIAQVGADPIGGNSAWVGTGLLGAVLAWLLLRHLPAKDAQLEKLIADHQAHVDSLSEQHEESEKAAAVAAGGLLAQQRVDFAAALAQERQDGQAVIALVIQHTEKTVGPLATALSQSMAGLASTVAALAVVVEQLRIQQRPGP